MSRFLSPLPLLALAQFLVILDVTAVDVLLPALRDDLGAAAGDLQWVVIAYAAVFGALLLAGGQLADRLGARRTFAAGLVLFSAASLACGLAPSVEALVAARAVQGVGAALLSPAALALLVASFPSGPAHRRAFAVWGALGGFGAVCGVVLGGVLTTGLGWRAVFLINVPVVVLLLAAAPRVLPAPAGDRTRRVGTLAATALAVAVGTGILSVDLGVRDGWMSAGALAAMGVSMGALTVLGRLGIPGRGAGPLETRTGQGGLGVMLVAAGLLVATFFLVSLLSQAAWGNSALTTGLLLMPAAATTIVGAHLAGRALRLHGMALPAAAGLAVAAVGFGIAAAADDAQGPVAIGLAIATLGLGAGFVTAATATMTTAVPAQRGTASGLLGTAHELGGALGLGVLVSVGQVAAGGDLAGAAALSDGVTAALATAAGLAALAALAAGALLPRRAPEGVVMAVH
jgi:MFS family permease